MTKSYSEEELLEGLRAEDHTIIEHIYVISKSRLYKSLLNIGVNDHDIADLIQESFVILIDNIRKDKFRKESKIVSYLIGIAKFKHLNNKRLLSTDKTILGVDLSNFEIENHQDNELKEKQTTLIRVSLKKLSIECQDIIKKFYYQKVKLVDLAKEYNYQENYIRTKKNRCMKKLRELVNQ